MTFCLIVLDCGFWLLLSVTSGGGQKAWRSAGWWLDMEEWCRDQGQLGVLLMSDVRLLHLSTCGRVVAGLGFTAALLTCLNVTTPRHTLHGHRKPAHSREHLN